MTTEGHATATGSGVGTLKPLDLNELRTVQMRVLRSFVSFCREHQLTYYLYGGTLLGAVVHQGYIPWDDDIDLIMPRRDYEAFRSLVTAEGQTEGLVVIDERAGLKHPYPFIKLGESGTVLIDHTAGGRVFPINIDIFPLDPWARAGVPRVAQRVLRDVVRRYIELTVSDLPHGWRRIFARAAKLAAHLVPAHRAAAALGQLAQWGRHHGSDVGGLLAWGPGKFMPLTAFGQPQPILFEGEEFAGPSDADTILTLGYSSRFRIIPPLAQQVSPHHFDAFG